MHSHALAKWSFAGNVVMFLALAALLLTGFRPQQPAVLSVERLNIVDSTGRLALVLSNGSRLPGIRVAGKEYVKPRGRVGSAGMIFYNEAGDEVGGIVYRGSPGGPRDTSTAFGHLSFDQWKQNQVIALEYLDNGTNKSAGLRVWDRPQGTPTEREALSVIGQQVGATPLGSVRDSLRREYMRRDAAAAGQLRAFLGSANGVAALELRDGKGKVRIRLSVDTAGTARLAFLDTLGRVSAVYPTQ
jgi:hypothetical protein